MSGNEQKLERVTSVLPCAEAPLTLANLAEYILTDIWVRFRKQDGRPVLRGYIDDALQASRSSAKDPEQREAAAREAVRRPRTLKLFQLEGDSVSAGNDFTAGASARSPGAVHLLGAGAEGDERGTGPGLSADTYLRYLDPSALRYNVAAAYHGGPADMHIPAADFREKYNRDVVDVLAGLFRDLSDEDSTEHSKSAPANSGSTAGPNGEELRREVVDALAESRTAYEAWNFARVLELSLEVVGRIRSYMATHPKEVRRSSPERGAALGAARVLSVMLAPILPVFAAGVKEFLKVTVPPSFEDQGEAPPEHHACCRYRPLAAPLSEEDIRELFIAAQKESSLASQPEVPPKRVVASGSAAHTGLVSPEDLGRVEIRAGLIISAEIVEGADKLLRLEIDLGEEHPRPVLAGLREAYEPDELKGLTIACVANMAPRETRFGVSRAMILAAGDPPAVFTAHRRIAPGDRLR